MLLLVIQITQAQEFQRQRLFDYIKECDIKFPIIVYKQACHETSWFTSPAFKKHNNLFGLRANNKYIHFTTWQECVEYYKIYQQSKYKDNEDYYKFLVRIKYAEDSLYCQKLRQMKFKL